MIPGPPTCVTLAGMLTTIREWVGLALLLVGNVIFFGGGIRLLVIAWRRSGWPAARRTMLWITGGLALAWVGVLLAFGLPPWN